MKLSTKIHLILYAILTVVIVGGGYYYSNKVTKLKSDLQTEQGLKNALIDSVHTYQNNQKEIVSEKLSLQANLNELKKLNGNLSANQKELVGRIEDLKKKNQVIAAALVQSQFIIDSLQTHAVVSVSDSSVSFTENNKNINYNLRVNNVAPIGLKKPTLFINYLKIYNKQFIEFHWAHDKKVGYPVSFSITNSNPYFATSDVDSYIIPQIKKQDVKPTFWKRIGNTLNKTKNGLIWGTVGASITYIIMKR